MTKLFRALADVHTLFDAGLPLFRLSIPPSRAIEAIDKLAPTSWFADGAGAILWLAFADLDAHNVEQRPSRRRAPSAATRRSIAHRTRCASAMSFRRSIKQRWR